MVGGTQHGKDLALASLLLTIMQCNEIGCLTLGHTHNAGAFWTIANYSNKSNMDTLSVLAEVPAPPLV